MTGIFWNINTRLPAPYNTYVGRCNPIAFLLSAMRDCLIYGKAPHRKLLLLWFVVGVAISALGIRTIYKNENSYVKVI
jgi:ABC-type polysaccharide/polyol phosphate export permease